MSEIEHGPIDKSFQPYQLAPMDTEEAGKYIGKAYLSKQNAIVGFQHLDEVLGLDLKRWSIVGIRVSAATGKQVDADAADFITVYAVDGNSAPRSQKGAGGLLKDKKPIEVVEFRCNELTLTDLLRSIGGLNIDVWSRGFQDRDFYVTGKAVIPKEVTS